MIIDYEAMNIVYDFGVIDDSAREQQLYKLKRHSEKTLNQLQSLIHSESYDEYKGKVHAIKSLAMILLSPKIDNLISTELSSPSYPKHSSFVQNITVIFQEYVQEIDSLHI